MRHGSPNDADNSHGIATTQEAELLIGLDRKLAKAEPAWIEFLVGAIVDFAVWGTRPTGYVDAQTGTWLLDRG